jgi:transcriptional regulator with XRE-family HTH domain
VTLVRPGKIIRVLRTASGVSVQRFAERLGVTRSYLSQVEHGRELKVPVALMLVDGDDVGAKIRKKLQGVVAEVLSVKIALMETKTPG